MKNVLVIGSTGQIGSELTMKIRNMYPEGNVVAGYIKGAEPKGVLLESGPAEEADVCNGEQLLGIVKKYNIDTIYNLAALLSAVAERKPQLAWHIQIDGLMNILEIARENNVAVFTPSSIGSFVPVLWKAWSHLQNRTGNCNGAYISWMSRTHPVRQDAVPL